MKIKILLLALCCLLFPFIAEAKKETPLVYDIECAGTGGNGTYLVKVTVYTAKAKEATNDLLRKAAVHGVVFKGFKGTNGCVSQKALTGSPMVEHEHADFFSTFFKENGQYMIYSDLVKGSVESMKVAKKYATSAVISVSKDLLRKDLERVGIIRGLGDMF